MGGLFNDLYGFRFTCDIMAFSSLALAVIYFVLNLVPFIIEKNRRKRMMETAK